MSPAALLGGPASSATLPPASLTIAAASSGVVAPVGFQIVSATALGSTIATIDDAIAARWSTLLDRVGDFELTVPYDSTAASSLTLGRVVKITLDGIIAASYLIEERVDLDIELGEEAEQNVVVRGRALDAFLDRGAVIPTLGWERKPWAQTRTMSFASPAFTIPGSWNTPKQIVATMLAASPFYTARPTGFWSLYEDWIGPSVGTPGEAPTGFWYTIYDFTIATAGQYMFCIGADNSAQVYVDGFLVANINPQNDSEAYVNSTVIPIYLTAGVHRFAAKIVNLFNDNTYPGFGVGTTQVGTNPTALAVTCWSYAGAGYLVARVFGTRGYANWKKVEYPPSAPGMTFAQSFNALLNDAKADGSALTALTLTTTAADTTTLEAVTFQVGDTLLKVLTDAVQSGYCDWRYGREAHTLELFTHGGRGVASGVTYAVNADPNLSGLQKHERDKIDVGTDVLVVEYADGQMRVPSSGGTRTGFLRLNSATRDEATKIATQVLADQAQPEQITVKVQPTGNGDYPWINVDVGDTASFNPGTGAVTQRVHEMHGTLTDDGVEFELVVKSVHLEESERLAWVVQRAANGSLGGTAPSAPAGPAPKISRTGGASEITFQLADGATAPVASPEKLLQQSGTCYGVKVTAKTSGSTATTFQFLIDGVDRIGSFGVLPAGAIAVMCPFQGVGETLYYIAANVHRMSFNVTAIGTGATGVLLEPQFANV